VLQFLLVEVKNEDFVSFLQEVTSQTSTNSLRSCKGKSVSADRVRNLPPDNRMCFCGGAATAGVAGGASVGGMVRDQWLEVRRIYSVSR
jgi:hypothetical protein